MKHLSTVREKDVGKSFKYAAENSVAFILFLCPAVEKKRKQGARPPLDQSARLCTHRGVDPARGACAGL